MNLQLKNSMVKTVCFFVVPEMFWPTNDRMMGSEIVSR
jgi:hypothetical protein